MKKKIIALTLLLGLSSALKADQNSQSQKQSFLNDVENTLAAVYSANGSMTPEQKKFIENLNKELQNKIQKTQNKLLKKLGQKSLEELTDVTKEYAMLNNQNSYKPVETFMKHLKNFYKDYGISQGVDGVVASTSGVNS